MAEKKYVDGMIVKRNEKAPDFVICNLSLKTNNLIQFLKDNESNGWLNVDIKIGKSGKYYAEVNTWKPKYKDTPVDQLGNIHDKEDIPF